jgi:multiple sugar transport system permease protein
VYAASILLAASFAFPFLWSALTSFKTQADASQVSLLPAQWTLEGYRIAFGTFPFARFFLHSALLATAITLANLVLCSLAGYALARLRFPGAAALFAVVLGAMMVPDQVRMVPVFGLLKSMGLIDSYLGVLLIAAVQPFGIFLMRQHFLQLPKDLEEAARIDGAGHLRTFVSVMLPLTGPALAALAILTFQGAWNDFFWPLLILQDPDKATLPLGLALFTGSYDTQWSALMAASMIATLPILVLFVSFQRYFVSGVAAGAVK